MLILVLVSRVTWLVSLHPAGVNPEDPEAFPVLLSAISGMTGISSLLYVAYVVTFATTE
jgi:hypothetical protein